MIPEQAIVNIELMPIRPGANRRASRPRTRKVIRASSGALACARCKAWLVSGK
ncbi:MAG: hypothetical protein ACI9WU_000044 [Myxococcota bacterium]|jgi:hypothetical protein